MKALLSSFLLYLLCVTFLSPPPLSYFANYNGTPEDPDNDAIDND